MQSVFPVAIIVMSVLSGVGYALKGQPAHAVYWIAASVLNVCVLLMREIK